MGVLIPFGGTTSFSDVFQLCFENKCTTWILQHLLIPTNKLFSWRSGISNLGLHPDLISAIFRSFRWISQKFAVFLTIGSKGSIFGLWKFQQFVVAVLFQERSRQHVEVEKHDRKIHDTLLRFVWCGEKGSCDHLVT